MSTDNMNKNVVKFGHGIEISERTYTLIAIVCTPPEGGEVVMIYTGRRTFI